MSSTPSLDPNACPFIPRHAKFTPDNGSLNLCLINTQSATNKLDQLQHQMAVNNIDILLVTETWFKDTQLDSEVAIPGYSIFRRDRDLTASNLSRGGGVAVYFHNSISPLVQRRSDLEPLAPIECVCLELKLHKAHQNQRPVLVFNFYRPPHQPIDFFVHHLHTTLVDLVDSQTHSIVVTGDFNAKLSSWCASDTNTPDGISLQRTLDNLGLYQLTRDTPSRYSPCGRTHSLLDLVITNNPELVHSAAVLSPMTDHCPILYSLFVSNPPTFHHVHCI